MLQYVSYKNENFIFRRNGMMSVGGFLGGKST